MTFNFTHAETEVQSDLVGEAYYNEGTRELVVLLGFDGEAYKYDSVPPSVYRELVAASSVGGYYNRVVKRDYGPGTHLGTLGWDNEEFFVNGYKAPAMAAVVNEGPYLSLAPEGVSVQGGHFELNKSGDSYFSLVTPTPARFGADLSETATLRHDVVFTVNGAEAEKSYTVDSVDLDGAVDALDEIADMLGVDVSVKRVTVHFE